MRSGASKPIALSAPLGVFDSGLGGLTVVQRLQQVLPNERIIYVADQAHVPYGGRDLSEVKGFACGISQGLLEYGCKALVMACNISSATALEDIRLTHPGVPVLGVIAPGSQAAALKTRNGRIGVLATEGTVRSGAYTRNLTALDNSLQVIEVPCPAFVPLVEAESLDEAAALEAARQYLLPIRAWEADTVILGCTHYPFLLPQLRLAACDALFADRFIDPAEQAACELAKALGNAGLLAASPSIEPDLLTTTGNVATFATHCARVLSSSTGSSLRFAAVRWQEGRLSLSDQAPL